MKSPTLMVPDPETEMYGAVADVAFWEPVNTTGMVTSPTTTCSSTALMVPLKRTAALACALKVEPTPASSSPEMVPATPPLGSGSSTKAPCTLDRLSALPAPSPVLGVSEAVPSVMPMATLVVGTSWSPRVVPPTVSRSVSVSVSRFAATSATGAAAPMTFDEPKTPTAVLR
jgi:hypothetical protein